MGWMGWDRGMDGRITSLLNNALSFDTTSHIRCTSFINASSVLSSQKENSTKARIFGLTAL
jgi:hypothetical protein